MGKQDAPTMTRRNIIIGASRKGSNMLLIDPVTIVTRLRLDLENLFQINNQIFYLGRLHPPSVPLTVQMANRAFYIINDLAEILGELEPRKLDTKILDAEESLTLLRYREIKLGLIQSWEWIDSRERELFKAAKDRADQQQGRAGL